MNTLWWWLSNGPLGFFTSAIINMPIYKARFYTRLSNSLSRWRQCNAPVYDDHVEVVPVVVFHLSSSLDDVLQLVVVHLLQVVHLPTLQLGRSMFSFTKLEIIKNFQGELFLLNAPVVVKEGQRRPRTASGPSSSES